LPEPARGNAKVAFDREDSLRKAEKLLRQGRLDAAIAEYLRVVEHQPRDWNTGNLLGDLYIRAGQTESAVVHYSRVAEHLAQEGFLPKAAALYRKIVKIAPEDESVLLRASELSVQHGMTADAKSYLTAAYQLRLRRGDRFGAAQLANRLASLDPSDLAGRLSAAKASSEWGDAATAARQFKSIAAELTQRGQAVEALQALTEAVRLDPTDTESRGLLVRCLLDRGDVDQARKHASAPEDLRTIASELLVRGRDDEALQILTQVLAANPGDLEARLRLTRAHISRRDLAEAARVLGEVEAAGDPQLLLTLAEIELRARHLPEAGRVLRNLLTRDRDQSTQIVTLGCALGEAYPEAGFECIAAVVDMATSFGDLEYSLSVLERFAVRAKTHVPALLRLVDVCVDGNFEHNLYRAQAQLADAYLAAERWDEARVVSEDLLDRRPDDASNTERLMTALVQLGVPGPDEVIAERILRREQPEDLFDFNKALPFDPNAGSGVSNGVEISRRPPIGSTPAAGPQPAAAIERRDVEAPAPVTESVPAAGPPVDVVEHLGIVVPAPASEPTPVPVPPADAIEHLEVVPPTPAVERMWGEGPPPAVIEDLAVAAASPAADQGPEANLESLAGHLGALSAPEVRDEPRTDGDLPEPDSVAATPEVIEIDLSDALTELLSEAAAPEWRPSQEPGLGDAEETGAASTEGDDAIELSSVDTLEGLFGHFRAEGATSDDRESAMGQFIQAQASLRMGLVEQARELLTLAVRSAAVRFDAASLLGRIARDSGDARGAVEWFERAAEAPAPSPPSGQALLYELGDTLETLGERARALAVFIELQTAAPGYRDVSQRVEWLSTSGARS
jgi:tetratricopeptide (TPR) repeat protein